MSPQRTQNPGSRAIDLSDEDAQELLPWYVTGKTTPEETAAIDRKLAASPGLQAELALARQEHQIAQREAEAIGAPSPALLDHLLTQLDGARQLKPIAGDEGQSAAAPGRLLARLFGFMPAPALRVALVVASLVVVVEGAALLHLSRSDDSGAFQTASAPEAATGPELIVRFQPNAGIAAIGAALSALDAGIVRGPMPDGAYVVALPQGADAAAAMAKLRGLTDLVAGVDSGS